MRITFNGAARTVTGSQHLLEVNGSRFLLDCGLFQGRRVETYDRNRQFRFDPSGIQAVVLSHAHIDHSGNLPSLVKAGFQGAIHSTRATADLSDIMLRDAGHIQEADAEYLNKKRARHHEPPVDPLYTQEDAARVAPFFSQHEYDQPFEVIPGVTAQLFDAGHILGSAAIRLEIEQNGRKIRLWFSGDIGRDQLPILRNPVLPHDVDYMMMECTYGDKLHDDPMKAYREFHEVVLATADRGGKVIIPAFAVGRTQELVFSLNLLVQSGGLKDIPVYVDSPLATNATHVYNRHPECYDAETLEFIKENKHPALAFKGLKYTGSVEDSKAINDARGPMVIISASGMAEAGRILHHLKNNIEDPRNTICIVGWQAPNTLGRRLAERADEVRIFGEYYKRRANVVTIGGLSAHAGQDQLIRYAVAQKDLKGLILVHGEEDAETALRSHLENRGITNLIYPDIFSTIEI
jgi:metallo-beta-lactamase family protein